MAKKTLNMLLIMTLVFQTISSSLFIPLGAAASNIDPSVFKDVTFADEEGQKVDLDKLEESTKIEVEVLWSSSEVEIKEGYSEVLALPDELHLEQEMSGAVNVDQDVEEDLVEVGKYDITLDGTLTVTFNEIIEKYENAEGTIHFEAVVEIEEEEEGNNLDESADTNAEEVLEEESSSSDEQFNEESGEETENETEQVTEENDGNENEDDIKDKVEESGEPQSEEESLVPTEDFSVMSTEITENIITGVTLTKDGVELQNGEEIIIESPYNQSELVLKYEFALPNNHIYGDGSTFTIQVPDIFKIPHVPETEQQDLARGDGTIFGSFYTEGNDIIITFNENIQMESNITGNIKLESNFDENYDGPAIGDTIIIPISGEDNLEFPIIFIPDAAAIEKRGIGNRGYNTETIEWTVDLNKNLQTIENAVLEDVLTEGDHSFIDGSLRVYQLNMNANGEVDGATELMDHEFGSVFPLELGTIDSAYRVVYKTEVNDMIGQTYKNNVTLSGDEYDPVSTQASVSVNRGQPLEKEATHYDDVSQTISWEVRYNYDEKVISQDDAKLADIFGDNQKLVDSSFVVMAVEIDQDTGEEVGTTSVSPDDYTLTVTDEGFNFNFKEQIHGAYKIIYETTAIDRVDADITIDNTISDEFDNTSEGSRPIRQGIFIKSHGSTDYETKETNWSVLINRDERVMKDVIFTDTLPEGFTPENLQVTHDGDTWGDGDQYDYSYDESTGVIEIQFNQDLEKRVYITYTTSFNIDEAGRGSDGYTNSVSLEWVPESETEPVTREDDATFDPDDYTKNNGFKHGSYDLENKEITWTIGVNYNKETLDNVVVEDFILGNQNFEIDSVKVYQMNLTGSANGYEKGEEVTGFVIEEATGPEGEPGFTVTLGDITTPFIVEYTTDLNDRVVKGKYFNEATIISSNKDDIDLSATVNPRYGGEFLNKRGQQNQANGRIVNWSININFSQSTVSDLVITDIPSINQTILRDTLVIYETTINGNNINKNSNVTLEEGEDYTLEFSEDESGQESFTVAFENEVDSAYVLEYDSYILYEGDGTISNKVTFEAKGEEEIVDSNETSNRISFNNISGSITGEVGSLQVTKVDFDDTDEVLEGATFELYDETGVVLLRTATTDANGIAAFNNLLYSNYLLKESEAPEGYVAGIEDTVTVTVNQVNSEITVKNKLIHGSAEMKKVDAEDGSGLEGALFEVQTVSGYFVRTVTSDENGFVSTGDLRPGNYQLVETQAPFGFTILDDEPIPFEIELGQQDPIEIGTGTIENEVRATSIKLTKKDDINGKTLEDAAFTLIYVSGKYTVDEQIATTNEDGIVIFDDLKPGTYQIEESASPEGYIISDEPIEVEVTLNHVHHTQTIIVEVENSPYADIQLQKVDADSEYILAGAVFDVVNANNTDETIDGFTGLVTDTNGELRITGLPEGEYRLQETEAPTGYTIQGDGVTEPFEVKAGTNTETIYIGKVENEIITGTVELIKVDGNSEDTLEGVAFTLNAVSLVNDGTYDETIHSTDENGQIIVENLRPGQYVFEEVEPLEGYQGLRGDIPFEIEFGSDARVEVQVPNYQLVDINIVKIWKDDNNQSGLRPDSITVNLLQNGERINEAELTSDDNWTYSFEGLDAIDANGNEYDYTIEEERVSGYETSIDGYEITNLRVGSTEVEGTKTWLDNESEDRPDLIEVQLLQNGEVLEVQEITNDTNWRYSFDELDAFDENGVVYDYTIEEVPVDGYDSIIDHYDITNVRSGETSVEVTKEWLDAESEDRPDMIEVNLLQNGEIVGTEEVTAENGWVYTFEDLPKYDEQGVEYSYTIVEKPVSGYETSIDGYNITNLRVGTIDVDVSKTWRDDDPEDRPETIVVNLLKDGAVIETQEIDAEMDWAYSFTNLAEFNEQGKAYAYTVTEHGVPGYDSKINGYELINTRTGETSVAVTKAWLDDESEDRPTSITVDLLQNGAVYETVDMTADNDWQYQFDYLAAYDENGQSITYTVEEHEVDGYTTLVNGYDITNVRSGETSIEVTKSWLDDESEDRPDMIVVNLLQNGENVGTEEVTAENGWVYTFDELPKYDEQGVEYSYTIEEEPVSGYETSIDGFDITNTLISTVAYEKEKEKETGEISDETIQSEDMEKEVIDTTEDDDGGLLPDTATTTYNMIIFGIGLVIIGLAFLILTRRQRKA
ncbi:Cna B-type domain-containing protein [Salipaludibacillus sp. HK11]|uniref:Cna B-type domain-containing protein n=1 Tax=Salipaludibacillus sp. HK11 TaxID=3394320 RepID=UPI0039FBF3AA